MLKNISLLTLKIKLKLLVLCFALSLPGLAFPSSTVRFFSTGGALVDASNEVNQPKTIKIIFEQIDGFLGQNFEADLTEFSSVASGAKIHYHNNNVVEQVGIQPKRYYKGKFNDLDGGYIFLMPQPDGTTEAFLQFKSKNMLASIDTPNGQGVANVKYTNARDYIDKSNKTFHCESNHADDFHGPSSKIINNLLNQEINNLERKSLTSSLQREATIVVETDYEIYSNLGEDLPTYVQNLFAYVSAIYQSEANTKILISDIHVYNSTPDPWPRNTTIAGTLDFLEGHWETYGSGYRNHVHLLSGRLFSGNAGGSARFNQLIGSPNARSYAVSAGIAGDYRTGMTSVVWDALVVAHEIGHVFGSEHTHVFDNPRVGSSVGGAIDCCYSESATGQCGLMLGGRTGYGYLPGIDSLSGGQTGVGAGTIMSYCHSLLGGISNTSMTFGNSDYGIDSFRVSDVIRTSGKTFLPVANGPNALSLTVQRETKKDSQVVGTVMSGISCGERCLSYYDNGDVVQLLALPKSGEQFKQWTGSCAGTSTTCTVMMDSNKSATATFWSPVNLSVSKGYIDGGNITSTPSGISCGNNCFSATAQFDLNTTVNLTAVPYSSNFRFAGWGGACTGTGPCSVVMNDYTSVSASFIRPNRRINYPRSGNGSGAIALSPSGESCGSTCQSFFSGDTVTLRASPNAGSRFTGWSGASCSGTAECVVTVGDGDLWITANFALIQYTTLDVSTYGGGSVTSSPAGINCGSQCSQTFETNSVVTLTANPANGYQIDRWYGACDGVQSTVCNVTLNYSKSAGVDFKPTGNTAQSIAFGATPYVVVGGYDTVRATASSGLPVTFSITPDNGVCSLSGAVVTGISQGVCTVYADQAGNSTYAPAPKAAISFNVLPPVLTTPSPPTITAITPGPRRATINFTPPTNNGGAPIASYTASCTAAGQTTRTATGAGSPITVSGLTGGVSYSCSLTASNGTYSSASSASTAVTAGKSADITPILMLLLD